MNHESTGFNVETWFRDACRDAVALSSVVDAMEQSVRPALSRFVALSRTESPDYYAHLHKRRQIPLTQMFLCGHERTRPHLIRLSFSLTDNDDIAATRPDATQFMYFDHGGAIDAFLITNPNFLRLRTPADAARDLVEVSCLHNPKIVGPPIDVAIVDGAGTRWVWRKEQCKA